METAQDLVGKPLQPGGRWFGSLQAGRIHGWCKRTGGEQANLPSGRAQGLQSGGSVSTASLGLRRPGKQLTAIGDSKV